MGQNKLAYHTLPTAVQINKQTNKMWLITSGGFLFPLSERLTVNPEDILNALQNTTNRLPVRLLCITGLECSLAEVDALMTTIITCT